MGANAVMYAGDSKLLAITIGDRSGAAVNLAGATITYAIVELVPGGAPVTRLTKTLADGVGVGGAGNNVVNVQLAEADTAALVGEYRHELEIVDSAGNISTAM